MKILLTIIGFFIFFKLLFFWLWLWQLKEYHLGRFKAHFESQAFSKIISSFWRLKYPKFTLKIAAILLISLAIAFSFLYCITHLGNKEIYFPLPVFTVLALIFFPLLVLTFQIPVFFLRKILLCKAEKKRRELKNLVVIGITGSYGKTSTKEFLAAILSEKFKVLKTAKHINAEIGIAQTILKELKPEHQIFIAEIGAYEKGKIKEVCRMLQPGIGILTGINEQHLSTFGSQENIIGAKYELIESLPPSGLAIFNGNNIYCRELYQKTTIARRLVSGPSNTLLPFVQHLPLWDVEVVAMAETAAKWLGMNQEEIARSCQNLKSAFQVKKGINGLNVIDSTYSANPNGVIAHLDYLKNLPGGKIIIMPCLIELGKASKEVHKRIGKKIGEVCDLAIITTQDRFKEIKEGAKMENIFFMEKSGEILERIKAFCKPGDVILLESRVPKELITPLIK